MQCKGGNKKHVWNAQRKVPNQLQKILSVNFRTPDIITARILLYNFFTKVKKFFTKRFHKSGPQNFKMSTHTPKSPILLDHPTITHRGDVISTVPFSIYHGKSKNLITFVLHFSTTFVGF